MKRKIVDVKIKNIMDSEKIILEIKIPRDHQYTPESAVNFFSGLSRSFCSSGFFGFKKQSPCLALEIAFWQNQIRFYAVMNADFFSFFESQILATYPLAVLIKTNDYLSADLIKDWGHLVQGNSFYYPLKTFREFGEIDSLSSILSVMSRAGEGDFLLFQLLLESTPKNWQKKGQAAIERGIKTSAEETKPLPGEGLIKQKITETGLRAGIRLASSSSSLLKSLIGGFSVFSLGEGNYLVFKKPLFLFQEKLKKAILNREGILIPPWQIFSVSELATLWHLPSGKIHIPNIAWGKAVLSEPPENLPAAINLSEEEKKEINFFARTEFRNRLVSFGIKTADRRRHMYIIGKTGTGKSTLIANMAIDDLKKRRGLAVIDPHGDLSEILLDYIPSYRINDVCYLDPADKEHPFALNIMEVNNPHQGELVASGIISIFQKLYSWTWGPRLEHVLRNTLLTLTQVPNSTLVDVPRILTQSGFRKRILEKINDPVLLNFWKNEFQKMPPNLQQEAISPILNKVGQFVSSPLIRQIIGRPRSTVNLERIMNEGKVLIVNLSQGKLGEDNSALLGAMIITKLQLAAMNRVNIPEEQRRDFYLYVDEFQNFATDSFIKILSEARKYRLCLCLANQYMAQIAEPVQKAILGNAGTLISFVVGAEDAQILEKEFGGVFTAQDLVNLSNFQIIIKLAIDNLTSRPFFAYTLPLPLSRNQNREKVLRVSRQRYSYRR
ncbi:MAG: type IV secretory system conjugative DNA transfer family protein [Microgenomates group bacterium]